VESIVQALLEHVRGQPGAQVPASLMAWRQEVLRIQAEPALVLSAIAWLGSDANSGEFRFVVQSAKSLRAKLGRIVERMNRAERAPILSWEERQDRERDQVIEDYKRRRDAKLAAAGG